MVCEIFVSEVTIIDFYGLPMRSLKSNLFFVSLVAWRGSRRKIFHSWPPGQLRDCGNFPKGPSKGQKTTMIEPELGNMFMLT